MWGRAGRRALTHSPRDIRCSYIMPPPHVDDVGDAAEALQSYSDEESLHDAEGEHIDTGEDVDVEVALALPDVPAAIAVTEGAAEEDADGQEAEPEAAGGEPAQPNAGDVVGRKRKMKDPYVRDRLKALRDLEGGMKKRKVVALYGADKNG